MGPALLVGLVFFLLGLLIGFAVIKAAVRSALEEVTIKARIVEPSSERRTAA